MELRKIRNAAMALAIAGMAALSACSSVEPTVTDNGSTGGTISISLQDPNSGMSPMGIIAESWGVTGLDISIYNITGGTSTYTNWNPSMGYITLNIAAAQPGMYRVNINHRGTNAQGPGYMSEYKDIEVRPMVISRITIVPGFVAQANVDPNYAPVYLYNYGFDYAYSNGAVADSWKQVYSANTVNWISNNPTLGNGLVVFDGADSSGIYQDKSPYVPMNSNYTHYINFRFLISNSTVIGDGAGYEAPLRIYAYFYNPASNASYIFDRQFNYTHDADSASKTNFQLVSRNVWTSSVFYLTNYGIPQGSYFGGLRIYSYGTGARLAYVDYAYIY